MRLNPMHNALFLAATLLRAETVALKLIPDAATNWSAVDVAVGDTAQLENLGWQAGELVPELKGYSSQTIDLFGISEALTLYKHAADSDWAVSVNVSDALLQAMPGQFLFHERRNIHNYTLGTLWLGLGCSEQTASTVNFEPDSELEELFELVLGVTTQVLWGLYHNHQVNADATTGLQGIAECRNQVTQLIRRGRSTPGGIACYMIGIDDYQEIKHHKGTGVLDTMLKSTALVLQNNLRAGDGCYRYSDAIFAVLVQTADETGANKLALKLQQQLRNNEATAIVTYSIGYIFQDSGTADDPLRLTLCAELALGQAKSRGPAQLQAFSGTFDPLDANYKESKLSLVTADPARDHRNSQLLWKTIGLFAAELDAQSLCSQFAQLLKNALGLNTVELLRETRDGLAPIALQNDSPATHFNAKRTLLAQQALQFKKTIATTKNLGDGYWLATPFVTRNTRKGCLFVERTMPFDAADQLLLKALADQLTRALDRIDLILADQQESEQESDELKTELRALRKTPGSSTQQPQGELAIRSYPMKQVVEYATKIAATDAPVLILGEQGSGKTLLASIIHAHSNRADGPFLVLDLASGLVSEPLQDHTAHSQLEVQHRLFGDPDKAVASSGNDKSGMLMAATGGTLLIDEICALPSAAQTRLLDFLTHGSFAYKAGNHSTDQTFSADTRVICTTNRNLVDEVETGRFSEALYQRLQFIQLAVPALRERTADIPVLAKHFIAHSNEVLGKSIDTLSDNAWQRLMTHSWPGNVRQLQQAILQASVTSQGNLIDLQDLRVLDLPPMNDAERSVIRTEAPEGERDFDQDRVKAATIAIDANNPDSWAALSQLLGRQIHQLLADSKHEAPIGRWLADAVVLSAAEVNQFVARRAAKLLGVPETTLRRQLRKAKQNADNPFQVTSQEWLTDLSTLRTLLTRIMSEPQTDPEQDGLADQCQALVLAEIAGQVGENRKLGAALMGVTPPTYSRWLERYEIALQPIAETTATDTGTDYSDASSLQGTPSNRSSQ